MKISSSNAQSNLSGTCQNCNERNIDLNSSENEIEWYNSTLDNISATEKQMPLKSNKSENHTLEEIHAINQTYLQTNSTLSTNLSNVDISSKCLETTKATIKTGTNNATKSCNTNGQKTLSANTSIEEKSTPDTIKINKK